MEIIDQPNILAVEGSDEVHFFDKLFRILEIENVQTLNFDGKGNFPKRINALPNVPGFENVRRIGFIRDADTNPARSAFDSICTALNKSELIPPSNINSFSDGVPSTGIFIMPDNEGLGMLEDLCLRGIQSLPINACIEDYFFCIESIPDEFSKASIQVYLAGQEPLVKSLGLGAQKNHFDFSANHFDSIKSFLRNFT